MIIVKAEHVYNMMRKHQCHCYTLLDGKDVIGEQQDDSVNVEQAIDQLSETISMIGSSSVDVVISDRSNEKKSRGGRDFVNYKFRIRLHQAIDAAGSSSGNMALLQQIKALEVKLLEQSFNAKFDDMKRKLEGKKETGIEGLVKPYLPQLIEAFTGQPVKQAQAPINGIADDGHGAKISKEEKQKRMRNALIAIEKVDGNLVETMEHIAKLATDQPQTYLQYVQMLKATAS